MKAIFFALTLGLSCVAGTPFIFTGENLTPAEAIDPVSGVTGAQFPSFFEKQGVRVYILDGKNKARDNEVRKVLEDVVVRLTGKEKEGVRGLFLPKDSFVSGIGKLVPKKLRERNLLIMQPIATRDVWIHEWLHFANFKYGKVKGLWQIGKTSKTRFLFDQEAEFALEFEAFKKKHLAGKQVGKEFLFFNFQRLEFQLYALQFGLGEELDLLRFQFENQRTLGLNSYSPLLTQAAQGYLATMNGRFSKLLEDVGSTCKELRHGPRDKETENVIRRCDDLQVQFQALADKMDSYSKLIW